MPNLAGVDVGLTLVKPTSGVCRTGDQGFLVDHTFIDTLSRSQALAPVAVFDLVAIDGPVLPAETLHYQPRACETAFCLGLFQRRCKPGMSHVPGTGRALRRAGCDTAKQFASMLNPTSATHYPLVQTGRPVVEAFPNAFIGVLLPSASFSAPPQLRRGDKFYWLLKNARERDLLTAVLDAIDWRDPDLRVQLHTNQQHDQQAALVCALTAACAWRGQYVAVGNPEEGFFFLPPWPLWDDWAKTALRDSRVRTLARLDVWLDGELFRNDDSLPP